MGISQEPFCMEIYKENAGPRSRGPCFVRACAVETHMDISPEPLCRNLQEKCRTLLRPPRLNTGPFTLSVRTPSVWPHCLGTNDLYHYLGKLCDCMKEYEANKLQDLYCIEIEHIVYAHINAYVYIYIVQNVCLYIV